MSALFCSFCDYRCHSDHFLLKHLRDFHENDPNFQVNCSLCGKSYKKWCSLKKHLHRVHSGKDYSDITHIRFLELFMFIQPLMQSLFSIMKIVKNRIVLMMNGQITTLYMTKKWISSGKVLTFCYMLPRNIHSHILVLIVFASQHNGLWTRFVHKFQKESRLCYQQKSIQH